jgi:hypothetical protein
LLPPHNSGALKDKEESSSFLKKRTKKLFSVWAGAAAAPECN